jgi:hypothetical protein
MNDRVRARENVVAADSARIFFATESNPEKDSHERALDEPVRFVSE